MSDHAIGVDLGGTNLRAARVDIDGHSWQIVEQRRMEIGEDRSPERICDLVIRLCDKLSAGDPLPVGIGVAAMLDGTDGVLANAPNLGWRDVPFGSMVTAQLGRRVWVENDLSAITWGESRFGAARGFEHVICVFVGTGVGGGAVVDGRLLRGANNVTMEVGHIKVVLDEGRVCGCGQRGCLEAYVGGRSLEQLGRSLPGKAYSSRQFHELGINRDELHSGHVDRMARDGEANARAVIERAGRLLGQALANLVIVFNPECLLLGGTVLAGCPHLSKICHKTLDQSLTEPAQGVLEVRQASLGDDAGVLGAADLGLLELR